MVRPKVPLISKRTTLEAAIRIIDTEGLDELSIRRLARELNINGASLYHHFRNKDEILLGAAQLVLEKARTPKSPEDVDWREWFFETSRIFRRALMDHPWLVTVILKQHPHHMFLRFLDEAVVLLERNGVRRELLIPLIESLESFTIGSVLYTQAASADLGDVLEPYKALTEARRRASYHVDNEQLWEIVAHGIFDAVLAGNVDQPVKRKTARRSRPSARTSSGSRRGASSRA